MKKFLLMIQAFFMLLSLGFSQACLPEGIVLNTQEEIDSFHVNYPGCNIIEGTLSIEGENITNLNGLIGLTEVGGSLLLGGYSGVHVTDLSGLDSLESVGGTIYISNCYSLQDFSSLQNLRHIGGNLSLYRVWSQNDLRGLDGITEIGGDLTIMDCEFTSFSGLENLVSLGGSLELDQLYQINNLDPLHNLNSISGDLHIHNTWLWDISALENIPAEDIANLTFYTNWHLSFCHLNNICSYLSDPNGEVKIEGNAIGCNSQQEVEDACLTGLFPAKEINSKISFYPNPATKELYISSKEVNLMEVNIYDLLGQMVLSKNKPIRIIDISNLNPGIYTIEFISLKTRIAEKLIVQ